MSHRHRRQIRELVKRRIRCRQPMDPAMAKAIHDGFFKADEPDEWSLFDIPHYGWEEV